MKRFITTKSLLILTTALALAAPRVQAQTAVPEQQLRQIFENILEQQSNNITSNAGAPAALKMDGDIEVEQAGTYYAVTLPHLGIEYQDGQKVQIGMISINASPTTVAGEWKMTIALPTPITGFDAAGKETMRLTIGDQKVAGLWNETLQNFTKLDASYGNLRLDFPANDGFATIDRVQIRYDFTADSENRWSGPARFKASGAAWNMPVLHTRGKAGLLSFNASVDRFAPQNAPGASALIFTPAMLADPGLYKSVNALSANITAESFEASFEATPTKTLNYALEHGNAEIKIDKVLSGTADASAMLDFSDFSTDNPSIAVPDLTPSSGHIVLEQKSMPIGALSQAYAGTAENPMALPMMVAKIPALLSQAGTTLRLDDSFIEHRDYRIDGRSLLKADITALNNATGDGRFAFRGLDKVLSALQVESTKKPERRNAAAFLEKLKTVGRVESASDNEFVHVFDLKLDPSGAFLINGKSYDSVFGAPPANGSAPIAAPPPAVTKAR